jgi:hypothetical protein
VPFASVGVAVNCVVAPTWRLAAAGLTVTDATGTLVTAMADVPLLPSLVAVMVAEPAATPVTNPLALTVATAALLLAHVTARKLRAVPFESFGVAVNCVAAPAWRLAAAGLTVTDATDAGGSAVTAMAAVPVLPPLEAVIVADPVAIAVTRPLPFTVATLVLPLLHVTFIATLSPLFVLPYAASCSVPATSSDPVLGVTSTCASVPRFLTCELAEIREALELAPRGAVVIAAMVAVTA